MWIVEISAKAIMARDNNNNLEYKRTYDVADGWIGDVEIRDGAYIIGAKKVMNDEGQNKVRINFMSLPVAETSIFWKDIDKVYKVFSK